MVHGGCKSVGCYAMTDYQMEEIYGLAEEAFEGGQAKILAGSPSVSNDDTKLDPLRLRS